MAALSELETLLSEADGGTHRDARLERLKGMEQRLQGQIKAGVGREEFPLVQGALQAVRSAQEVLSAYPVGYAAAALAASTPAAPAHFPFSK